MLIAVWIIAAVEVIRMVQNALQLLSHWREKGERQHCYDEFVKSLKTTDEEFARKLNEALKEEFEHDPD